MNEINTTNVFNTLRLTRAAQSLYGFMAVEFAGTAIFLLGVGEMAGSSGARSAGYFAVAATIISGFELCDSVTTGDRIERNFSEVATNNLDKFKE